MWSKIKSTVKKVGYAASGVFVQGVNTVKEVANRALGVVDFAGGLVGIRPRKKLRLKVVILRDGSSLLATHAEVMHSVRYAQYVFKKEANVDIIAVDGSFVKTAPYAAPSEALEMNCGTGAWTADLGKAGDYFGRRQARSMSGTLTGYAAPVTAFIIRNVRGKKGCSLGPLVDYITVDVAGLKHTTGAPPIGGTPSPEPVPPGDGDDEDRPPIIIDSASTAPTPRLMVHELAHICGLWHLSDTSNLAHGSGPGITLRGWQKAIIRNSRYVTYL